MELLKKKPIIGMVHCLPLVGTVNFKDNREEILDQAIADAKVLKEAGFDAIMIENMNDNPLGEKMDLSQRIALASIAALVKDKVNLPIGVDAAFNDYETSLAIAKAIGGDFVRIPVFIDTVVAHTGILSPCAREALLYRKNIAGDHIKILADIQVKHTHMLLSSIKIEESAKLAESMGADAIIVTGISTGYATPIDVIEKVKKTVSIPVIIGSGINKENIKTQMEIADGAIVGSCLKENKKLDNPISIQLANELITQYRGDTK